MTDMDVTLWKQAMTLARQTYEENYGNWDDADKFEKEDLIWYHFEKLKGSSENAG